MKISYTMDIDKLIEVLEEEKALGAKTVTLYGAATVITDHWNSVIITTEPQM